MWTAKHMTTDKFDMRDRRDAHSSQFSHGPNATSFSVPDGFKKIKLGVIADYVVRWTCSPLKNNVFCLLNKDNFKQKKLAQG